MLDQKGGLWLGPEGPSLSRINMPVLAFEPIGHDALLFTPRLDKNLISNKQTNKKI